MSDVWKDVMRARNIKPGFFKNDDLAEVDPMGRLLFVGLWMMADREGRLVDRPKRIKGEVFPYDNCDVDALLDSLQEWGFIVRYEVDGQRFIQVLKFKEHQNPHVKEAPSTIPAPDKHSASTRLAPDKHSTNPAERGILNPESPLLNPESVSPSNGIAVDTVRPPDAVSAQASLLAKVFHSQGVRVNPGDPRLRKWAGNGLTAETVLAAIAKARERKPGRVFPFEYFIPIVEEMQQQADGLKAGRQANGSKWDVLDAEARTVEGVVNVVDG